MICSNYNSIFFIFVSGFCCKHNFGHEKETKYINIIRPDSPAKLNSSEVNEKVNFWRKWCSFCIPQNEYPPQRGQTKILLVFRQVITDDVANYLLTWPKICKNKTFTDKQLFIILIFYVGPLHTTHFFVFWHPFFWCFRVIFHCFPWLQKWRENVKIWSKFGIAYNGP